MTLAEIKANAKLREMKLIRQSRLSVTPLTAEEFREVLRLSKT
ncbi:MAG: EVE domain-containing protein [Chthoniobacter sp.]